MASALSEPAFVPQSRGHAGALVPLGSTLPAAFVAEPALWLPEPATPSGEGWWDVTLAAGPLRHRVRCHVGPVWDDAAGIWRLLSWRPQGPEAAMLPILDGVLGITAGAGMITLVLDGRYRPPGGRAGKLADAAGLRRVAQSTAHRFVTDIAARMRDCAEPRIAPVGR